MIDYLPIVLVVRLYKSLSGMNRKILQSSKTIWYHSHDTIHHGHYSNRMEAL
jgi:hypothetical protein